MEHGVTGTTLPEFEVIEADGKTLMRSYGSMCIEGQIKDLLRITKELTFWGDGFPGEKNLKIKSFCYFLSYIFLNYICILNLSYSGLLAILLLIFKVD